VISPIARPGRSTRMPEKGKDIKYRTFHTHGQLTGFDMKYRNNTGQNRTIRDKMKYQQAHPVFKYRFLKVLPRPGWAPDPLMVGIRSPDGLVVGLAPATLEFWVRFPNERNQGKQAHPVLKYRVPQGSQCVMGRLVHTGLGSSSLVAHVLPYPPPPPCTHLCTRSCSNKHTHPLQIP
jgi:hypothetical protein